MPCWICLGLQVAVTSIDVNSFWHDDGKASEDSGTSCAYKFSKSTTHDDWRFVFELD